MNNLLPSTSSVLENLFHEYEEKALAIRGEVKELKNLLKECQSSDCQESRPLKNKEDNVESPKPKPLSQRNSLPSSNQRKKISKNCTPVEKMPEQKPDNSGRYKLKDLVNKVKNEGLEECSERIDYYVELRETPDKRTELEKQRFLFALDKKWEEDFKAFKILDPGVSADLLKSISASGKSEPKPKDSVYQLKKKVKNEQDGNSEQFLENTQKEIDMAVLKDLFSMDFDKLSLEDYKGAAVALYKTVSALNNIKNPKPGIVFKKEPWQSVETADD